MNFFDSIRSWFIWATNKLVGAAMDAYNSWLPLDWLGDALNALSTFTSRVAGYLFVASNWYEDTRVRLLELLSWSTIQGYIRNWLTGIEAAVSWFLNWWLRVGQRIDYWWLGVWSTVQDWIDAATQGLDELKAAWGNFWSTTLPDILGQLELLRANWRQFWTVTFPTLVDFTRLEIWWNGKVEDIQRLIRGAMADFDDLFTWWADFKEDVVLFFTDPWAWLYNKFDDFFERFW